MIRAFLKRKFLARRAALSRAVIETLEQRKLLSVPNGPYALSAAPLSSSQVSLNWRDNASNETGFSVQRRTATGAFSTVATLAANSTGFTDGSLVGGTQYTYRVFAFNNSGASSFSGDATAITPVAPGGVPAVTAQTVPNGPYTLSASAASSTQIDLKWHDNSNIEAGFKVERCIGAGAYSVIAALPANTTAWSDKSVSPGVSYTYRVKAYNAAGDSSYTNPSTTTTPVAQGSGGGSASGGGSGGASDGGGSAAGFFPVGVYYQPTWTFDNWKSRGVNTLYGYENVGGTVSMAQFDAAAAARGFQEIRQPAARPSTDRSVANLVAWLTPIDEPDLHGTTPASLAQQYASLKAVNGRPIITTYSGGYVLGWQGSISAATYQNYLASTDWVAADIYPVGGWNLPNRLGAVGQLVDKLQALAPGKKQYAFIETSNPTLPFIPNDRGVTPDEFRGEVWDAVIHGANGIVYFPQKIGGGFSYDYTPPGVAAEMTRQDARLQQYGAAINSSENPGAFAMTTGGSLEATWRYYNGKVYYFVLNLSPRTVTNQTMRVAGVNPWSTAAVDGEGRTVAVQNGTITDTFKPYEMHVYVV